MPDPSDNSKIDCIRLSQQADSTVSTFDALHSKVVHIVEISKEVEHLQEQSNNWLLGTRRSK